MLYKGPLVNCGPQAILRPNQESVRQFMYHFWGRLGFVTASEPFGLEGPWASWTMCWLERALKGSKLIKFGLGGPGKFTVGLLATSGPRAL